MEYVKLGNSDLNVSRICLGCMGFGDASIGQHSWTIGEEPTREIIRRSLDLGVNFFDTAIGYQLGTSEQYVGRALKDMARRNDMLRARAWDTDSTNLVMVNEVLSEGGFPRKSQVGDNVRHL